MLVDARGQKCPLPVLRVEKAAAGLKPGDTLTLLATDPMARIDVPHFCAKAALQIEISETADGFSFSITRPTE